MTYEIQLSVLQQQSTAVVRGHVDVAGIPEFLGDAFGRVLATLAAQGLEAAGPPFARYHPFDDGSFDVEAGFPASGPVAPTAGVEASMLPGGECARVLHVGDYGTVGSAYTFLFDWATDNGEVTRGEPWESYLDGPEVPEPRTLVFLPYASPPEPT